MMLRVMAVPQHKSREVPCLVRPENVAKALADLLEAEIEELERKKAGLERQLAVLKTLKEMGL